MFPEFDGGDFLPNNSKSKSATPVPTLTYLAFFPIDTSPLASTSIRDKPVISFTENIVPLDKLSVIENNCPCVPSNESAVPEVEVHLQRATV